MSDVTIVANYIVKVGTPLEFKLFEASLASVRQFCDRIAVVYNCSGAADPQVMELFATHKVEHVDFHEGAVVSFADNRNCALKHVKEGEFFYWIDADEVGFPLYLKALRERMVRILAAGVPLTQVRTRFTHFCINPMWYEKVEPRVTIMRKGPDTHWEGAVHERVVDVPAGHTLHSDYMLHHYGYCKPQEEVFKHWQHYAELEGDPNHYRNEEVDGKCVPYFRPGDRPGPANILDDRKKVLLPYTGEYPDMGLLSYLMQRCPNV